MLPVGGTKVGRAPAESAGWGCTTDEHGQAIPATVQQTAGAEVPVLWQTTRSIKHATERIKNVVDFLESSALGTQEGSEKQPERRV